MPPPDPQALHKLALQIEEARRLGDFNLADRLVVQFNTLVGGGQGEAPPPIPPRSHEPVDPNVRAPSATRKEAREALLAGAPQPVSEPEAGMKTIGEYPAEIQPLLTRLLDEVSLTVQVPHAVLTPQFIEELDALVARVKEAEPLLAKLSEPEKLRSILLRYHDELLETLKQRNH